MTPEERALFGISEQQEQEISSWVLERVGYVLGATGRGGSGVFVELPDGRTALLTAGHVLIPAILSGEVTVAHYNSGKAVSVEPAAVRMARRADAALIFLPATLTIPARLPTADWDPRGGGVAAPKLGDGLISAGAPGAWKAEPDLARRVISSMKTLLFWTAVIDPKDHDGLLVADVDEKLQDLPSTFRGMSGGPVFTIDRRLIGVNHGEHRGVSDGRLYAVHRADWDDLLHPFDPPADMPVDFNRQEMGAVLYARHELAPSNSAPVLFTFEAEFFWSPSNPDHQYGEIGRVVCVTVGNSPETRRYRINVESIFHLPPDHTEEERAGELQREAMLMLKSMRYEAV